MSLAELKIDPERGIATITVNRPQVLNAIDVPTARAIFEAVRPLQNDPAVRCIVLRGNGRAFIAGGDLARFAEDFDQAANVVDELLDALHPTIEILRGHDAPVLASVHGAVAGAGLSLMAACDLVVAAEGTRFLLAYDRIGASPDCGGTWFLPRLLGERRAAELMMLGETWDAETAQRMGLVNRVSPADGLDAMTESLSARLASGPTLAYGAYKRLASQAYNRPLLIQLDLERAAFKSATRTADFRAGVEAFLGRSTPVFAGR
ncbi:enoyl-CoA hydratase [Solimonas sp. K1W22B-7]|uniref:enoyl-CoA hydratase/isomerase family protein n=1 Tax=Solimonas sp. K1W22B-7 TaxID=2303331 RepID=UPI000E333287|nr:enoyl-CoA hydratase-related protein [Solimonas sp. K1W22B-7]AXQ31062.1 enoyl-CoA hydratase [Solimonas sp. K1W22B-7]